MSARDETSKADAAFHDVTADVYEETLDSYFRAYNRLTVLPWLRSLPGLVAGRDALDVGCGTGVMAMRIAEQGFFVRGVDHSEGMLAQARQTARRRGLAEQLELHVADIRELPFEPATFDVVACQGVLHHLPDYADCVAEIARVLKPGGVYYVAEPCHGSTFVTRCLGRAAATSARLRRRETAYMWSAAGQSVPSHEEAPIDAHELRSMLDKLGLEPELAYWSTFPGMRHVRPLRLQQAAIFSLSRPWQRRAGDLVIATGRKPYV